MEYKCDMCGAPATVHITKIIDGKKIKMHLCADCAAKNSALASAGFPADIIPNIKKLEQEILSAGSVLKKKTDLICPNCGSTLEDFEKRGRFACPECYKAFKSAVEEILAQMHGSVSHIGKRPKSSVKAESNVDERQIEIPFEGGEKNQNSDMPNKSLKEVAEALFEQAKEMQENSPQQDAEPSKEEVLASLKSRLESAISDERYEDAAKLRDEIKALESEE